MTTHEAVLAALNKNIEVNGVSVPAMQALAERLVSDAIHDDDPQIRQKSAALILQIAQANDESKADGIYNKKGKRIDK